MNRGKAIWQRAWRTLFQSAVGAGVTAVITGIGTAQTIGEVNWQYVASTAVIAMLLSLLMNIKANLPEVKDGE